MNLLVGKLIAGTGLTPVPQDPWWRTSLLLPRFEAAALVMRRYLPGEVAGCFQFEGRAPAGQ